MSRQLDPRLKTAIFAVAAFGAMFTAVGGTVFGLRAGASIAVGATIGASNLYALARVVRALATPGASRSVASWTFALLLKMILLFGGIWLLLAWHSVTVIPLVVGYMTVPIGVALGSVVSDRTEPPEAAP